jgi:hypothetical protein
LAVSSSVFLDTVICYPFFHYRLHGQGKELSTIDVGTIIGWLRMRLSRTQ